MLKVENTSYPTMIQGKGMVKEWGGRLKYERMVKRKRTFREKEPGVFSKLLQGGVTKIRWSRSDQTGTDGNNRLMV
jgi:hypothetical protein